MIAALIYTIYAFVIGVTNDPSILQFSVLFACVGACVLSVAFRFREGAFIVSTASCATLLWMFSLDSYYSLAVLLETLALVVPLLAVYEFSFAGGFFRKAHHLQGGKKRRLVVPLLYVALLFAAFAFFTQNELYRLYFLIDGHEVLQLLILISVATILFVPFYEKYR